MKLDNNTGLVLEGGGMRGVFTCGVLDAFMKHNMYFNYVVAVSAGAGNGMSYMSRQPGRARITNIDYMDKFHFIGLRYLLTQGCIFDAELLYDKVPNEYVPFDYDAYFNNPATFEMVTTNCLTGRPMYLTERHDRQRALDAVRASTSLPLVTPPVEIDGHKYVDGGVADSVPIEHVLEEAGFDRAVVIVTQDRSYEKKPYEFMPAARARYADYPYLLEAIETRHDRYNIQRMHLWKYEREGRALVIAPQKPVEVGHVEHDPAKLLDLYIQGRQEAKRLLAEIQEFVER